ncbi:hydroxymethylglutaryl-CoA lyase [Perkinsela sp. CCAP 1560/4]|nr:hydroxymethylglutaryl-CoA lyase [Perkinsela sp. CCAP 1560/4]|eukprot:KNH07479.1 hydroxymethylglutaryl-CoA lyase [Perkinsela sp. CCAP 1560/4]
MFQKTGYSPLSWLVRDTPFRNLGIYKGISVQIHGVLNGCFFGPESPSFANSGLESFETPCKRYPFVRDQAHKPSHACPVDNIEVLTLCASPVYATHVLRKPMESYNTDVFQHMATRNPSTSRLIVRVIGIAHCPYSNVIDTFLLLKLISKALENGASKIILSDISGTKDQQYYIVALRTLIASGIEKEMLIWEPNDINQTALRSVHTALQCNLTSISCEVGQNRVSQMKNTDPSQGHFEKSPKGVAKGMVLLDVRSLLEFAVSAEMDCKCFMGAEEIV